MNPQTLQDTYPPSSNQGDVLSHSGQMAQSYTPSPMQQGLLLYSLRATKPGVYVQQMVCELREDLQVPAFLDAWRRVVDRHPVLRSCFRWEDVSEPALVVHPGVELPVEQQDWRGVPADEQEGLLEALLEGDRRRGFDLARPPLLRLTLLRRADGHYTCVWTYHHALLDGRSHTLVLNEVFADYEALLRGEDWHPARPRPYHDYIDWLRQQDWSRSADFWKGFLQGFRAPTPLLAVAPAPGTAFPAEPMHGTRKHRLSAELTAALEAFARAHELTVNTLLQGAYAALLSRYSGEEEVVFGATRACRRSALEGAGRMVGVLINTLPVRARLAPETTAFSLFRELRAQSLALRSHEHTPLVYVQQWSEVAQGASLFDSILVFESYELTPTLRQEGETWKNREFYLLEETYYPFVLCAYGGRELLLKALYQRPRFDDATIDRLFGHLQTLLQGMLAHPEQRVAALPVLTEAEFQQVVHAWNDTAADFPRDRCLRQLFEDQARKTPEAVAVAFEGWETTYRELNERANRLAHYLRGLGVGPGVLVGVCLERSAEMIVGVLGITKAGGAYVPLDPAYPRDRLAFMLEDTQAPVLLTQGKFLDRLPETKARVVNLDGLGDTLAAQSTEDPVSGVTAQDLAYIIYTSGSTGKPKGVVLRHGPVVNLIDWVNRTYRVGPGDRVLFVTSLNFDLSVYDIFGVLGAGATIRIASGGELREPERLLQILCEEPITFWNSAPPQLQQLAPFFANARPAPGQKGLRLVFLSGDWIPVPLPDAIRAIFRGAQVVSLGGATEAAIWSNYYPIGTVDPKWPSIPYGKPIQNARYHVLDRNLNPVPVGVPAELYIGGLCLADGYLNRPELTQEKFIADPFGQEPGARLYKTGDLARYFPDGNLEFLGRMDFQVKIRGFRIELGEIEADLAQHAAVRECLVTALKDESGDRYLCAYYVPRPGPRPGAGELRRFLQEKLPAHMVPGHFVALEAFPLSPNGKIDRKALPPPQQGAGERQAERVVIPGRNDAERDLITIWEDVLKVKPVSATDNFFDLGGHSFLAAVLIARVRRQLGHTLPLGTLFEAPTVEKLAGVINHTLETGSDSSLVPLHEEGPRPPLFMIAGVGGHVFTFHKFARLLGDERPVYGVKAIGVDGTGQAPDTVEAMAAHYVQEILAVRPQGPYVVSGFSIGAVVALELALQLRALGHKVPALVVFDMFAPGYPRKLPRHKRLWIHLRNFLTLPFREKKAYVSERLDKLRVRVRHWTGRDIENAPEIQGVEGLEQGTLKRVWLALMTARSRYRPQRKFDGRVLLFKAEKGFHWPGTEMSDPLMGWGELTTGGVEEYVIPGEHTEVFADKNITRTASELNASLAAVEAKGI
jgi:amino acid adenylation domain-containing protein